MYFLFRVIIGLFIVWLICYYFYSLGRKSALDEKNKKSESNHKRKKVDSTVVETDGKACNETGNNL